ncbi:MAG: hypothetical protein AB7T14_01335 [Candidatus Methylacidiphilaceae bacterium]
MPVYASIDICVQNIPPRKLCRCRHPLLSVWGRLNGLPAVAFSFTCGIFPDFQACLFCADRAISAKGSMRSIRRLARLFFPVALFLLAVAASHAAPPARAGVPVGGGAAGGMVPSMPLPDPTVELAQLQMLVQQMGQTLDQAIIPCLQYLGTVALQVALAMSGLGLAFGGVQGRSLAVTFSQICVLSVIVWVFCIGLWPQTMLGNLRVQLAAPSQQIGNTIAHLGPGIMGDTPTQWIMSWVLGQPVTGGMEKLDLSGPNSQCKFSMHWVQNVMWRDQTAYSKIQQDGAQVNHLLGNAGKLNEAWAIALWSSFLFGLGSLFVAILGAYLTIIMSLFAIALTQLFLLGGSELAWDLYVPLGMLLIPLVYLGFGRDYWRHYLTTLVSLAILPSLFWLLTGIGVAIMAILYNATFIVGFGSVGDFVRSAVVYATGGIYSDIWGWLSRLLSGFGGLSLLQFGGNLIQFLQWMYLISGYLLRYVAGVGIVAAFLAIPMTMAATSVQIAFSWTRAFSDAAAAWIGAHREHIDRVGGALSAGIGQMVGGSVRQVSDFFRNWPR